MSANRRCGVLYSRRVWRWEPFGTILASIVSNGDLARHHHDSTESQRPTRTAGDQCGSDLDVRSRSEYEPADVQRDHSLGARVAAHHNHRDDGNYFGEHTAGADRHARRLQLATR